MDKDPESQVPPPGRDGQDDDEHKSWAHQVTVGAALIVVSFLFFPEGIGALAGDSGSFMFRADDGEPDIFFGSAMLVLAGVMLIGGTVFVLKGLRKRKAEM